MEHLYRPSPQGSESLFIGGLSKETSLRDIIGYVEKFGQVLNIHMPVHKVTGKPLGYAFVRMGDQKAAARLVSRTNQIGNRNVDVQYAIDKVNKEDYKQDLLKRKIFIAGIKHFVDFDHIRSALQMHGPLKIFYRIETSHRNRGLAFAEFHEGSAAESVITQGLFVDGCLLRVSYFRPKPEDDQDFSFQDKSTYNPKVGNDVENIQMFERSNFFKKVNSPEETIVNQTQVAKDSQKVRGQLAKIQDSVKNDFSNYTFRILMRNHTEDSFKKISVNGTTLYIKSGANQVSMKRHLDDPAPKTVTAREKPASTLTPHNLRTQIEDFASPSFNSLQQAPLTKKQT